MSVFFISDGKITANVANFGQNVWLIYYRYRSNCNNNNNKDIPGHLSTSCTSKNVPVRERKAHIA